MARIKAAGLAAGRIGIESSFLPFDSAQALQRLLPGAALVDALPVLERLRERKTPAEIAMLRTATERVNEAMAEVFAAVRPGMTKHDLVQRLREAETARGLVFEYCLVTAGTGMNRAPSDQVVQPGDIILMHFRPAFVKDFLAALRAIHRAGLTPALLEDYIPD